MKSINRPLTIRVGAATLDADTIAAQALGFIAADEERLHRFMGTTGFDPASLRTAAASPGFARAIIGYLGGDEELLVTFATTHGLAPEQLGHLVQRVAGHPSRHDD